MSAEASDMSSWLLMGLPGVALLAGAVAAIAIIVVSLLTKAPSEEIQKEFEEIRAAK